MRTDPSTLPDTCGVYLFRSADGSVIYVGKAIDIRSRVRSHLNDRKNPKELKIRNEYQKIDWIATGSELEALILEDILIKKYNPTYNVRLKDDKSYPYLVITRGRYPAVRQVRGLHPEMGDFFGPHSDPKAVRRSLRWLRKIFPVRSCKRDLSKPSRPCLEYHIGRCVAPCKGDVDRDEYMIVVQGLKDFLSGKREKVTRRLKKEMWNASSGEMYERAAMVRDVLRGLERMRQGQKVVLIKGGDIDVISTDEDGKAASVVEVRDGRISDVVSFHLEDGGGFDPTEDLISSFYAISGYIPRRIVVRDLTLDMDRIETLERFLAAKRGSKLAIRKPRGHEERSLGDMALRNANLFAKKKVGAVERENYIFSLKKALDLPTIPNIIEGFDISHLSGTGTVASMVQFYKGKPRKISYRRFRIRSAKNDDYTAMKEAVARRYRRVLESGDPVPDLVLIDGGKGQLAAALEAMDIINIPERPPMAALAKREEEIFLPRRELPIVLRRDDPALKLLQSVRDEAHRFAVSYQRKLRKPSRSILLDIDGVGEKRANKIMTEYGNLSEVVEGGAGELSRRCSVPESIAYRIVDFLEKEFRRRKGSIQQG